jgi:hypothetical protein
MKDLNQPPEPIRGAIDMHQQDAFLVFQHTKTAVSSPVDSPATQTGHWDLEWTSQADIAGVFEFKKKAAKANVLNVSTSTSSLY